MPGARAPPNGARGAGADRVAARASILLAALLLVACAEAENPADFNKGDIDPALAAALEDQILIDPTLSQQANEDAIRPPDRPVQILVPQGTKAP